jgi:hypothetical protein
MEAVPHNWMVNQHTHPLGASNLAPSALDWPPKTFFLHGYMAQLILSKTRYWIELYLHILKKNYECMQSFKNFVRMREENSCY